MIDNKKTSILLVLKILEEYSDENHYLTYQEIIDKIYFHFGIQLERKSIASNILMLQELDYDIVKGNKCGVALLSRTFENSEVSFLVDALFSSKSVSGKHAKQIADKLSSCLSKYDRKDYSYLTKTTEINRTNNIDVFYNIETIHEAIEKNKRVGFNYITYDENGKVIKREDGYQYIVSPYYLVNNFGRYYLICNYKSKYGPISTFRLDYMINIEVKEDWDIKKLEDLNNLPKGFSISRYLNDHIYLEGGNVIEAELLLDDAKSVIYIKDWFGDSAKFNNKDDKITVKVKCDETALFHWAMQYIEHIKVISPTSLVSKIKNQLVSATKKYDL